MSRLRSASPPVMATIAGETARILSLEVPKPGGLAVRCSDRGRSPRLIIGRIRGRLAPTHCRAARMEESSSASPAEATATGLRAAAGTAVAREPFLPIARGVARHPWWVLAAWLVAILL